MNITSFFILAESTSENSALTTILIAFFVAVMVFILIRKIKKLLLNFYENAKKEKTANNQERE